MGEYETMKAQKDAILKRQEDALIAERDREWGLALCEIDVACHATSTRHGKISVMRDDEQEAPAEATKDWRELYDKLPAERRAKEEK